VSLGEDVELAVGDAASVRDTSVTLTLLAASGPAPDCNDCPNHVDLEVVCPPTRDGLQFAFSGGMSEEALDRARRGVACELEFYIVEVHDGRATVHVSEPT